MVVEELLQLLVDKVDGDLLEAVVLEDLKASNVKHSTEVGLLHGGVHLAEKAFNIWQNKTEFSPEWRYTSQSAT